jgi:hypothetical protein
MVDRRHEPAVGHLDQAKVSEVFLLFGSNRFASGGIGRRGKLVLFGLLFRRVVLFRGCSVLLRLLILARRLRDAERSEFVDVSAETLVRRDGS